MLKKLGNWVSTRLRCNKLPKEVQADSGAWVLGSDGRLAINGALVDQAVVQNCRISATRA